VQKCWRTRAKRTDGRTRGRHIGSISASEPNYPPNGQIYCPNGGPTRAPRWQSVFRMGPATRARVVTVPCGFAHPITEHPDDDPMTSSAAVLPKERSGRKAAKRVGARACTKRAGITRMSRESLVGGSPRWSSMDRSIRLPNRDVGIEKPSPAKTRRCHRLSLIPEICKSSSSSRRRRGA